MNEQTSTASPKKKKKHRFLKFIIIVVLIFLGIRGIFLLKDYISDSKYKKLVKNNTLVMPIDKVELTKEELNLDSSNSGITNKEKIDLGLDILSTDTDSDGLSDSDELNIYHSDPTKFSTSGDLLSDYYKVNNNLDVNKKYDIVPTLPIDTDTFKFIPKKAEDIKAYYKEYNGTIPSGYTLGVKPFRVYSFTGDLKIKVDNPDYYDVYTYNTTNKKAKKIKTKKQENNIIISINDDQPILITYKSKILKDISNTINSSFHPIIDNPIDNEYIVIAMPFFNYFFKVPVLIFQINDSNHYLEQKYNTPESKIVVNVQYIGTQEAKALDSFFAGFIKKMKETAEVEDDSLFEYFFYYKHIHGSNKLDDLLNTDYSNNNEEKPSEPETKPVLDNPYDEKYNYNSCSYCADSGFDVTKNAFAFSNLSTTVSKNGVCLGFSHLTTNAYNHSSLPRSLKNTYDMSTFEYDTIWNGNLHQYVPTSYLKTYADDIRNNEPILDADTMPHPDSEVVKALNYYWDDVNSDVALSKFSWSWNKSFHDKATPIDSDAVDEMIEKFKNKEIVSILLLGDDQHAINAYKIVQDQNDEDILYLKVYDNNFPDDLFWNKSGKREKYNTTITLYRKYETNVLREVKTSYLYEYMPLNNTSYYWRNDNGEPMSLLIIDEDGDVLG